MQSADREFAEIVLGSRRVKLSWKPSGRRKEKEGSHNCISLDIGDFVRIHAGKLLENRANVLEGKRVVGREGGLIQRVSHATEEEKKRTETDPKPTSALEQKSNSAAISSLAMSG